MQENQNIFSPESVPEGFVLGDPDHLKAFEIDSLYNHWLKRQSKGLTPFVILNPGPNHEKLKKISEKVRGKKKENYVEVKTDDEDVKSEEKVSDKEEGRSGDDEHTEKSPAPKFGPPGGKRKRTAPSTEENDIPTQEAGPSKKPRLEKPKKSKGPVSGNVQAEKSGKSMSKTRLVGREVSNGSENSLY